MNRKQYATIVKTAPGNDPRVLRFIGSTEAVDRDGDVIDLDGWDVSDYMRNPVFLWAHDYSSLPVGKTVAIVKDIAQRALVFDVRFPTAAEIGEGEHAQNVETIFQLYKGGYLSATSVGFQATEVEHRQAPEYGLHIMSAKLMELSGCPVPANPEALIQARSLKGISAKSLEKIEADMKIEKAGARHSAETRAVFENIAKAHKAIEGHLAECVKAHKEACDHLAGLMQDSALGDGAASMDDAGTKDDGVPDAEREKVLVEIIRKNRGK